MLDFVNKIDEVRHMLSKQGLSYKFEDICKLAASMSAPRFYMDAITALKEYNKYKNGKSCLRSVTKRKMYAEIFARYEKLYNIAVSTGQYISKQQLMERVLNQSAPSFYYEDNSALKMYYYAMSRKRRKRL